MSVTQNLKYLELYKYRKLNQKDLKRLYKEDEEFKAHFTVNNNYCIDIATTVAIFDFSKDPISGKYKSLVLDLNEKLVLTTQSSNKIINTIYHNIALGGQAFQNLVSRLNHYKYRNIISLGHSAYFSMKGHSNCNTSWVALHLFEKFNHSKKDKTISFESIKLNNMTFDITLHDVKRHVVNRLRDGLHHNIMVRDLLESHLTEVLYLQVKPIDARTFKSILYTSDLINHNYVHPELVLTNVAEELCDNYITRTYQTVMMEQFGEKLNCFLQDLKAIMPKVKRDRYNN